LGVSFKLVVDGRRAKIWRLVERARAEASLRHRNIETIDPLVICARRLFPYLHEDAIYEYARTALRIIRNQPQALTGLNDHQTTLLHHILRA